MAFREIFLVGHILYYWSWMSVEMAIFSGCCIRHWFHSWIQSDHMITNFTIAWRVNGLPLSKLLHILFAILWNFALSSKIQFKICCREEFTRYKIHRTDKICKVNFLLLWNCNCCAVNCSWEIRLQAVPLFSYSPSRAERKKRPRKSWPFALTPAFARPFFRSTLDGL